MSEEEEQVQSAQSRLRSVTVDRGQIMKALPSLGEPEVGILFSLLGETSGQF